MKETRFKQTEIGEIPEDWEIGILGDLTTHVDYRGKTPKKINQGIQLITAKNIRMGYIDYKNNQEFVSPEDYSEIMHRGYPKLGDVLITTEAPAGNIAQIDKENIALAQRVIKYRCKEKLNNDYLCKYFLSEYFQKKLASLNTGGTVQGIKGSILHTLPVVYPSTMKEQINIVANLKSIDILISSLEKLIEKKKNIKQGTMQQLLTGKKRLPGFAKSDKYKQTEIGEIPEDWEVTTLETISKYRKETEMTSKLDNNNYVGTEQMLSNKAGIYKNKNKIIQNRVNTYKANDVLISNIRPYLKKIWFANCYGGCSSDVLVFQLNSQKLISPFLFYILSDDNFFSFIMDGSIGTKMPRGDKKLIMSYPCCFPNNKNEQKAIVQILKDMDKEIEVLNTKLEKYRSIKQGMMQQLLTGKIRLI